MKYFWIFALQVICYLIWWRACSRYRALISCGICSSVLHEHGVSLCSWIRTGMPVIKREAVTMGKQQAGFLGLSSALPGLEAGHRMVHCTNPPSPSSYTYICASLEQGRILQSPSGCLWTGLLPFYCLERKISLYLLSTGFPGVRCEVLQQWLCW